MVLEIENQKTVRQLPKLKQLLNKYRQVRTMQSSLLRLSEISSTTNDINSFYQALNDVVFSLFHTNSFHIALAEQDEPLSLAYVSNDVEEKLIERLNNSEWQNSTTALVYEEKHALHCSSAERMALVQTKKINHYGSSCVDWLGVPLIRGHQIIGVIALQSYNEKLYFDDRDCQLLEFIAEHLVTAIDRVCSRELLEQNIQERTLKLTKINRELQHEIAERQRAERVHQVLLSISEITASSQDLPSFYQALHYQVKRLLPADNFYIAIATDKNHITCPYFVDQKHINKGLLPFNLAMYQSMKQTNEAILICHQQQYSLSEQGDITQKQLVDLPNQNLPIAWLSAPLSDGDNVFGMLALQDYQNENAYQDSDLELIRFVAQHIAIAIVRKRTQLNDQKNKDALELMVKERTKELEVSNLKLRMQIEERKKAEEKLYHDAHHDALTKLPNRAMFSDRLEYSLRHFKRHLNHRFAVLFIDLDRFKIINDTLGHHAGDEFLIEIAKRLSECIRDNDLLARLGGDEFVILLDNFQLEDDVEDIATRIIERVSQVFTYQDNELYSNASIGIAMFNPQYNEATEILRDADAAMYQAKSLGRGRYVFFDDSMREQLMASLTLEQELRNAIKEEQFELHYQEISSLAKADIIGFEAFLRWRHPTKGVLTPSSFLYLAEETGIILEIETWVLEQVARQLNYWQHSNEYNNTFIGVNLSGRHLTQANQLEKLMGLIQTYKIEPYRLILEFNEKSFEKHTELALKGLNKLKEFGVKLALDDYASGLSSFNFLHNYPFEFIKLDRSFIQTLAKNDQNISLVKALHQLGENFGYRLVAEGIENEETLVKLRETGCDFGQGYHISKPEKLIFKTDSDRFSQAESA